MKILMIGLGRIGQVFANVLLGADQQVELVAHSPKRRPKFKHLLGQPHFQHITIFPSRVQLESFDGFIVASPSDTHYAYLQQLMPFGKPIFCEKPIDLSVRKIDRIKQQAEKLETPILVGFNRRYDPQIDRLKTKLTAGDVGDIHLVRLTSRDPAPPPIKFARSSGGLFLDMVIHDFDMMRFLTDSEPETIYTQAELRTAKSFAEFGDVDTAASIVRMTDGTLVTIDNSRKAVYGYDQRIEVFGSKGMLQMGNQRHDEIIHASKQGRSRAPYKDFFMDRYLQSYQNEMRHFLEIVSEPTRSPMVSIDDALIATHVAICAERSRKRGREIRIKN